MKAYKSCSYMIAGIPREVIDILNTIIANSTANSLSEYLEERGGMPGIVTQERFDGLAKLVKACREAQEPSGE
jgi:hypothetical protein